MYNMFTINNSLEEPRYSKDRIRFYKIEDKTRTLGIDES